jgi:hypothetical protein
MSRSGLLDAWQAADVAEFEWTASRPRARHQVFASGVHRRDQDGVDDAKIIETASQSGGCLSLQAGMGTTVAVLPDLEGSAMVECFQRNLRAALYALIRSETLAAGPEAVRALSRPDPLPGTTAARGAGDYPSNTDSETGADRARL